ncbi:hypothetical protein AAHA92_16074 [Salvia divinorum]|uniref:Uncharacterized protein n=1 Tax=Salvia divinorum TaxID=28513 RepID=A0ABD1GUD4_SALDI
MASAIVRRLYSSSPDQLSTESSPQTPCYPFSSLRFPLSEPQETPERTSGLSSSLRTMATIVHGSYFWLLWLYFQHLCLRLRWCFTMEHGVFYLLRTTFATLYS